MTSPDLFSWLRGLLTPVLSVTTDRGTSKTRSRECVESLERLWPLALDVIDAIETGDRCLFCNAYYDDPEGHREDCVVGAFIAAAEKERA